MVIVIIHGCKYIPWVKAQLHDRERPFYAAAASATVRRSLSPWSRMVMTLFKQLLNELDKRYQGYIPNTEELSGSGTKSNVGTSKVVDGGLGEHGIVLKLRLAEGRGVARNQDQLGYMDKNPHRAKRKKVNRQHKGPSQPHAPAPGEIESARKCAHPCRCASASRQTCSRARTCQT